VILTGYDGSYKYGDTILLSIQFSEPVFVTLPEPDTSHPYITSQSVPLLMLRFDNGQDGYAGYSGGSGTDTLTFSYYVYSFNNSISSNGLDYVDASALNANGSVIVDNTGKSAILTLPTPGSPHSLSGNSDLLLNTSTPTVVNVSSSSVDGTFTVGETLSITVTFSEAVTVNGIPQMTLETGAMDRTIDYSSGSGTNILSFDYTIQPGDLATDLDYISTSPLTLNGGSIQDMAGNNALLSLAAPGEDSSLSGNRTLVIEGDVPTIANDLTPGRMTLITASDGIDGDRFGTAISLSDGYLLVGASGDNKEPHFLYSDDSFPSLNTTTWPVDASEQLSVSASSITFNDGYYLTNNDGYYLTNMNLGSDYN
jgi:hypothetical protein